MSTTTNDKFTIIQYNVQKSYTVMNLLLKSPRVIHEEPDIIAIQEPWLNSHGINTTHNPTCGRYRAFMSTSSDQRPMVCFFINSKISPDKVRVTGRSQHLCSAHVTIQTGDGEKTVSIHNLYNPCLQSDVVFTEGRWEGIQVDSALPELSLALDKFQENMQVVVGDFNLHHEKWYGRARIPDSTPNRKKQSEAAIEIMTAQGLDLTLPPGTITRPKADRPAEQLSTWRGPTAKYDRRSHSAKSDSTSTWRQTTSLSRRAS